MTKFIFTLIASVVVAEQAEANQISVECALACGISDPEAQRATYSIPLVANSDLNTIVRYATICPSTLEMWGWLSQHDATTNAYPVLQRIPSLQFTLIDLNNEVVTSNLTEIVSRQALTAQDALNAEGFQRKVEAMTL